MEPTIKELEMRIVILEKEVLSFQKILESQSLLIGQIIETLKALIPEKKERA